MTGPLADVVSCVRAFTTRFAGTKVEGLPDEPGQTVQERPATVDRLLAERVIWADEHARQRARILGETWTGRVPQTDRLPRTASRTPAFLEYAYMALGDEFLTVRGTSPRLAAIDF